MGRFDTVRKTCRKNKNQIYIMYIIIFILFVLVAGLYITNYNKSTNNIILSSNLEHFKEIYKNENKSKDEKIKELTQINSNYYNYLDSLPFGSPVKEICICSEFGWRNDPFNKLRSFHSGIDLNTSFKEPIIATGTGIIVSASNKGNGYGNCVQIKHPLGYKSLYAHLNKILVEVGQNVSKGDTIGLAGSTGRSTAVHLHYEIRLNGIRIDPYKYLQYFNNDTIFDNISINSI
jgi:murein DD-endopeptidase MepM/ murein hydrolase activator NlpD